MAFLVAARAVTVLLIDPHEHWGHGRAPGADIAKYLTRHGAPVTVQRVTAQGSSIADSLLSYVDRQAADLLVLGAYSHARLRETPPRRRNAHIALADAGARSDLPVRHRMCSVRS
jgi:nucleotide-binding universal stress UspA family protein